MLKESPDPVMRKVYEEAVVKRGGFYHVSVLEDKVALTLRTDLLLLTTTVPGYVFFHQCPGVICFLPEFLAMPSHPLGLDSMVMADGFFGGSFIGDVKIFTLPFPG